MCASRCVCSVLLLQILLAYGSEAAVIFPSSIRAIWSQQDDTKNSSPITNEKIEGPFPTFQNGTSLLQQRLEKTLTRVKRGACNNDRPVRAASSLRV